MESFENCCFGKRLLVPNGLVDDKWFLAIIEKSYFIWIDKTKTADQTFEECLKTQFPWNFPIINIDTYLYWQDDLELDLLKLNLDGA